MAQRHAERFVGLRPEGLASQPTAELLLEHEEAAFNVIPSVIVVHEFRPVLTVEAKHPVPKRALGHPVRTGRV